MLCYFVSISFLVVRILTYIDYVFGSYLAGKVGTHLGGVVCLLIVGLHKRIHVHTMINLHHGCLQFIDLNLITHYTYASSCAYRSFNLMFSITRSENSVVNLSEI